MFVPGESIKVEVEEGVFVATTSLIEGLAGRGGSDQDAILDLEWAVRAYVKEARKTGREVPARFRVSALRKVLWLLVFLALAAGVPVLIMFLFGLKLIPPSP